MAAMTDVLIKMLLGLGLRLLTEKFLARTIIRGARALVEKTDNELDDGLVDDLADALGQPDMKKAPTPAAK
jgi:hypothetical protein